MTLLEVWEITLEKYARAARHNGTNEPPKRNLSAWLVSKHYYNG